MAMGQVDSVEQAAKAPQGKKPPRSSTRRTTLHWRTRGGRAARLMLRSLALLLLILCVLEILRLTFVPSPGSVAFAHTNLHPFATIRLLMRDGTVEQKIFQIGGNIAIGVALGFLLPQITPYLRGLIRVEIVTVVFSVLVELLQHYLTAGSSLNSDDVILAAAGAVLGYVPLGRMFGMRLYPDHLHWWQRRLARSVERRRARGKGERTRSVKTGS
jgi:VanZ family protein